MQYIQTLSSRTDSWKNKFLNTWTILIDRCDLILSSFAFKCSPIINHLNNCRNGYWSLLLGSLNSLIWDFLLSQINIWTTTTWSDVWVVLRKPSWYEFLIGFLIWTPSSKYLHLTKFSNNCVILSMFLYLYLSQMPEKSQINKINIVIWYTVMRLLETQDCFWPC